MLVLTRHRGEDVYIKFGDIEVVVKVVHIRGDKVRLGFDAPREVTIHREEIVIKKPRKTQGESK